VIEVLEAKGVVRRFRGIDAVAGVDFSIQAGESLALLGPNGAGKTTLLRMLAGPAQPDSGEIRRPEEGVGWAPQRPAVYPRLTVRENLTLFTDMDGVNDVGGRVEELISLAALGQYADQRAETLSTGTLQRLNLSVAICGGPAVLLLDEPTATLSPEQRQRLWAWLEGLRRDEDLAVAFSTQSLSEAASHADRVLVLVKGRTAFEGSPRSLADLAGGDAEAAFFELAGGVD
jgi:ABC-2 type transport system ATP-binding protein